MATTGALATILVGRANFWIWMAALDVAGRAWTMISGQNAFRTSVCSTAEWRLLDRSPMAPPASCCSPAAAALCPHSRRCWRRVGGGPWVDDRHGGRHGAGQPARVRPGFRSSSSRWPDNHRGAAVHRPDVPACRDLHDDDPGRGPHAGRSQQARDVVHLAVALVALILVWRTFRSHRLGDETTAPWRRPRCSCRPT